MGLGLGSGLRFRRTGAAVSDLCLGLPSLGLGAGGEQRNGVLVRFFGGSGPPRSSPVSGWRSAKWVSRVE